MTYLKDPFLDVMLFGVLVISLRIKTTQQLHVSPFVM